MGYCYPRNLLESSVTRLGRTGGFEVCHCRLVYLTKSNLELHVYEDL